MLTQDQARVMLERLVETSRAIGFIKELTANPLLTAIGYALRPGEAFVLTDWKNILSDRFSTRQSHISRWVEQHSAAVVRAVYKIRNRAFAIECHAKRLPLAFAILEHDSGGSLDHDIPMLLQIADNHVRSRFNGNRAREEVIARFRVIRAESIPCPHKREGITLTQLIQVADDQNSPTDIVRLVTSGEETLLQLFTYLMSESNSDRFFLQIATPNRNLSRFSPHPFDAISLAQMLSLLGDKGYATDAIVANVSYYDAKVEAVVRDGGKAETAFTRPTTGTVCRPAETNEIIEYLELPGHDQTETRIGRLGAIRRQSCSGARR